MEHGFSKLLYLLALALFSFSAIGPVRASSLNVIHSFCDAEFCPDGSLPEARVVMDDAGNIYGTTFNGGDDDGGLVFEFSPNGKGGWKQHILHVFCKKSDCPDGAQPAAALILDTGGNLYGTTDSGGSAGDGVAFELSPPAAGGKWAYKVIHNFCAACGDGAELDYSLAYQGQSSGELYDGVSPLYGTTLSGGAHSGGTVFQLTPRGGRRWSEKILHGFCSKRRCADGDLPEAPIIVDAAGNLYGTTANGGAHSGGEVFELSPGAHNKWRQTILYSFCAVSGCADGWVPRGDLALDAEGNLYGTTNVSSQQGVLFKLIPNGGSSTYSVLYAFCSQTNCADGANPFGGVSIDSDGHLFGTTEFGGANHGGSQGGGTIFEFGNGTEQVLYSFCSQPACTDGQNPQATVSMDSSGNVFGTTTQGGSVDHGTVYEFTATKRRVRVEPQP